VDNLAAALQDIQNDIQKEITDVQKDIVAGCEEITQLCAQLSGQQGSFRVPSLHVQ
jgi:hypothetical protein